MEIRRAIQEVLEKGRYVGGEHVLKFEKEFAAFIGVKHAIGVNSGTDALSIAIRALGLTSVSTVTDTALATVAAIITAGAQPILVNPRDAQLAVHLHGYASMMMERPLIEDCAQSCGGYGFYGSQRLGSFGLIGCFSFYPTKNLGAIGDGGMIVTSDKKLAVACRQMREYGWNRERIPQRVGINSRLDPIQAAILRVKLKYLDKENDRRREIAAHYDDGLRNLVITPDPSNHCFHLYVIECDKRDELAAHLKHYGIGTGIHYRTPIHKEHTYKDLVKVGADLTASEGRSRRILSLPMYPELTDGEADRVIKAVRVFYQ